MDLESRGSAPLPSALQRVPPWGAGATCSPLPPGRAGAMTGTHASPVPVPVPGAAQ